MANRCREQRKKFSTNEDIIPSFIQTDNLGRWVLFVLLLYIVHMKGYADGGSYGANQ